MRRRRSSDMVGIICSFFLTAKRNSRTAKRQFRIAHRFTSRPGRMRHSRSLIASGTKMKAPWRGEARVLGATAERSTPGSAAAGMWVTLWPLACSCDMSATRGSCVREVATRGTSVLRLVCSVGFNIRFWPRIRLRSVERCLLWRLRRLRPFRGGAAHGICVTTFGCRAA